MKEILISGGGVAGSGVACAISRLIDSSEISVTLLEKETEDSLGSVRRGEVLRPEATKVIHEAGLMDYVVREKPVIRYSPRPEIWHTKEGKLGSIDYAIFAPDYPMIYLPHKQIVRSLHERMREIGIKVVYGAESETVDISGGKPRVHFRKRNARTKESEKISADLLIICDGATSKLRSSLGFPVDFYDYESGYLMVIVDRPKELQWGRHYLGEGSFLGLFSLPNDLMRAAIEVKSKDLKSWISLEKHALKKKMIELAPVLEDSNIRSVSGFYHVIRRHARRYVSDKVALVGDAAHTTHPQLGQGMSMVFFDVSTLSKLILSRPDSSFGEEELRDYELLARPYNDQIIRNAHDLTEAFEAIGKDPKLLDSYFELLNRVGFRKESS